MKRKLILRPSARKDIADGDKWYEGKSQGLGDRFLLEVQRCLGYVLANPNGFQRVHGHFHQAPLDGFPYLVVYGTDGTTVVVMRVFHTSQNTKKKFKKRK